MAQPWSHGRVEPRNRRVAVEVSAKQIDLKSEATSPRQFGGQPDHLKATSVLKKDDKDSRCKNQVFRIPNSSAHEFLGQEAFTDVSTNECG